MLQKEDGAVGTSAVGTSTSIKNVSTRLFRHAAAESGGDSGGRVLRLVADPSPHQTEGARTTKSEIDTYHTPNGSPIEKQRCGGVEFSHIFFKSSFRVNVS